MANRLKAKQRNKKHNSAAMYAHFTGARREAGKREGNIGIYWFDHGWFWFIPLSDGYTSIGAVVWPSHMKTRAVELREFFLSTIALCPPLAERLAGATLASEVEATGNYSYTSDHHARRQLPSGGRCLRVRRSGVLHRRDAGHDQRGGGRRYHRRLLQDIPSLPHGR